MSFYCDLFKKAFPAVTAASIVGQLSSGVSYFKYNVLGTDSTETEGGNIVSGILSGNPDNGINLKAVNWIAPDGRVVTTVYRYGLRTPAPSATSVPGSVSGYSVQPFVLVEGVYVAKLIETKCSPAHIETVNGTDYLVSYRTSTSIGRIRIHKHRTVLNMNITPVSIVAMPEDKVLYIDNVLSSDGITNYLNTENPYGDYSLNGNNVETDYYFPMHERTLVPNANGTKTIFAANRSYNGVYSAWPVYELTDIETGDVNTTVFSATELYEFNNSTTTFGANSSSQSGSGTKTFDDTWTLDEGPCPPYTRYYTSGVYGGSFGGNASKTVNGEKHTYFLGCAYDRKTDIPIICYLEGGLDERSWSYSFNSVWSGTRDQYVTPYQEQYDHNNMNVNRTSSQTGNYFDKSLREISAIVILNASNGSELRRDYESSTNNIANFNTTSLDYYQNATTGLDSTNTDYQIDYVYSRLTDINIISLSNRCYVIKEQFFDIHETNNVTGLNTIGALPWSPNPFLYDSNNYAPYNDIYSVIKDGIKTQIHTASSTQPLDMGNNITSPSESSSTTTNPPGGSFGCYYLHTIEYITETTYTM